MACPHSARYSMLMSRIVAPMPLSLKNPLTPKVEGKRQLMDSQNGGMHSLGHDAPDRKRKGTEVNTTNRNTLSR